MPTDQPHPRSSPSSKPSALPSPKILAHIAYEDAYVQPLILSALSAHLSSSEYTLLSHPLPPTVIGALPCPYLHITSYEYLSHESLLLHPHTYLANAYTIRKALIRKHYLASTVAAWRSKHPDDILGSHLPLTLSFELDYAEFLDDALVEAYELHDAWQRNADKAPTEREWWILKPGMSDRGQGIRLFSSEDELREIFEAWEEANPEEEDEEDEENVANALFQQKYDDASAGLMASQLRHFVVQPYIAPLLLPRDAAHGGTKFHLRSYVLAFGALQVFVHSEPLALFAPTAYTAPTSAEEQFNMAPHLTNTCLQTDSANATSNPTQHDGAVALFSSLPLPQATRDAILSTIYACTSSLFRAAVAMPTYFQPLPSAFELYGLDWLLGHNTKPWLLEVNAFPDFGQSGDVGQEVVEDVWKDALGIVLAERGMVEERKGGFVEVLNIDLGRR
jgi:tubulin---tyrosine ligase